MIHRINLYSQFLATEFMRLWVNPMDKLMLPSLWGAVPRWIQYCFSMLSILLHCSFITLRIGWLAISSADNCFLVNPVNAALIYNYRKLSLWIHQLSNTTRDRKHLSDSKEVQKTLYASNCGLGWNYEITKQRNYNM